MIEISYTFTDNSYVQIVGQSVKYWQGYGLPDYDGCLDGFAELHPTYVLALVQARVLKQI